MAGAWQMAAFCSNCGQAFAAAVATQRLNDGRIGCRNLGGGRKRPFLHTPVYAAVPRVEYAGFWVRFCPGLSTTCDGVESALDLDPLIFLDGLRGFIGESIRTKT